MKFNFKLCDTKKTYIIGDCVEDIINYIKENYNELKYYNKKIQTSFNYLFKDYYMYFTDLIKYRTVQDFANDTYNNWYQESKDILFNEFFSFDDRSDEVNIFDDDSIAEWFSGNNEVLIIWINEYYCIEITIKED